MDQFAIALIAAVVGAVLGVAGGFFAARHVDRLGARRLVYTAYIGAIEVAGWQLRRRLFALRDRPTAQPRPPMPDTKGVNVPLGQVWTIAPDDMMEIVKRMQDHLQTMELACHMSAHPKPAVVDDLLKTFDDLREELVNTARRQTWERRLPSATFRDY